MKYPNRFNSTSAQLLIGINRPQYLNPTWHDYRTISYIIDEYLLFFYKQPQLKRTVSYI